MSNINFAQYSARTYLHTIFTDSFIYDCCAKFLQYYSDIDQKRDMNERLQVFKKYNQQIIDSLNNDSIFNKPIRRDEAYQIFEGRLQAGQAVVQAYLLCDKRYRTYHEVTNVLFAEDPFNKIMITAKENQYQEERSKKTDEIYNSL